MKKAKKAKKAKSWYHDVDALCREQMPGAPGPLVRIDFLISYLGRLPCRSYTPDDLGGHGGAYGHLLDPEFFMHLLEFLYHLERSTTGRRRRGHPGLTDEEHSARVDEILLAVWRGGSTKSVIEQVAKQMVEEGRYRSPDDAVDAARMHIRRTMGPARKRR